MTESANDVLSLPVRRFIDETAAKAPTPGGGSVAAVAAALGTALGEMALNFTRGKKAFADHAEFHQSLARRLGRARGMFEDLVADDIAAFEMVSQAMAMPDGAEADEARQLAAAAAIDVPRELTKLALAVLDDLAALAGRCNRWLITDLLAGAVLCHAAVELSHLNVRINVPQVADAEAGGQVLDASAADLARAAEQLAEVREACEEQLP